MLDSSSANHRSSVSRWVANEYFPGATVTCEHVRSLTNDVYFVTVENVRYALKVYGADWRPASAVRWEVDLLGHLAGKGVPVANAVAGRDGEAVRVVALAEGAQRVAVLFEMAPGSKPQAQLELAPELYRGFGAAVAAMHVAGEDFASPRERAELDLVYLLDRPIDAASELVSSEDRTFLRGFRKHVSDILVGLIAEGLDWGPCHGDMTLDNLHVTEDGTFVMHDFDSGGVGWRASDLQGWTALGDAADAVKGAAFRRGYTEVRPLSAADIAAAPYLTAAWEAWGLDAKFTRRVARLAGEGAVADYVREQVTGLRELARKLRAYETAVAP